MCKFLIIAAFASAAISSATHAQAAARPECNTILPPKLLPFGQHKLGPEDLARLRDIGPVEPQYYDAHSVTVSHNGRWAAFQLRQADPQRNTYCLAMVVFDLARKVPPRIVDEASDPLLLAMDLRGIADFPTGIIRPITPRWSGDDKWIAFLKHFEGTTQVWRAYSDGSASAPVTHSDIDVVDFRIGADGSSIVYATRPGFQTQARENNREGLNGWHYDSRFVPWLSKRPLPIAPVARQVQVLDVATQKVRTPTSQEVAMIADDHDIVAFAGKAPEIDASGLMISATRLSGGAQAGSFHAKLRNGSEASCTAAACVGAINPWWMPGKTHVRFRRWEGWANASTAIYDWDLRSGEVRRLYLTDDVLSSCTPRAKILICLVQSSLEPTRLIELDPVSGKRETLFDPNPEFARLTLGKPIRLHWRNALGIETVGDLVLPVDYRPGQRYPMVVVQYDTRGFLRGGTDDEYPIQAFANRGYAVLSFKRPESTAEFNDAKQVGEVGQMNLKRFADRRSVESSLEAGVKIAIDSGIADSRRVGITGLSDGSTTVEWALIHSSIFSAAALSSCCWDVAFVAYSGPGGAQYFHAEGYPGVLERDDAFWKDAALEVNARHLSTPILVNASEEEFLTAVETYSALREAGVPIDMFVYPDEYHARWQPAHRLATYRRSLDWFDYWLRDIRSVAPDRQSELKEWDRLKTEGNHGHPI